MHGFSLPKLPFTFAVLQSKAPGKGLETSVVGKGILLLGGGDQTPLSIAKSIAVEDLTHIFQTEGTEPNLTSDQKPKG